MKNRNSLITFFLLAFGLSATAQAPTHVQTRSKLVTGASSSINLSFSSASTDHHLVVVHLTWDKQTRNVNTVSDAKGNTYHLVPGSTVNWGTGGTSYRSAMYYAYDIDVSGSPLSISATLTGSVTNLFEMYISEYSGVLTTSDPLDKTSTNANSGTTISSGSITTTSTNELVYGVAIGASAPIGTGGGFNNRSSDQDNIVEDKHGATVGTYSATFTGSGFWVASVATFKPLVSLPVNLVSFYARLLQDNKVQVDWGTAGETNNDHFEIEHSQDGLDWASIGRVEAGGNTDAGQEYSFTDAAPYAGLTYYRLKQVDRNGNSTFSKTLTMHTAEQQTTAVKAYPNPANAFLFVEGAGQSITVFNMAGQQMPVRITAVSDSKTTLDLSSIPTGAYFLKAGVRSVLFYKQ
jgi:hypothetical protein